MGRVIRTLVMVGVALGLAGGVVSAGTKEVIVVTSFPKELFENYRKAFEAKHAGVTMVINAKQTNAGVTYLQETKAKPAADIFWVSAPDAFQALKTDGLLEKYSPPKEILGVKVTEVKATDGYKFICADSSWLMMRLSGTEPILRVYAEASSEKKALKMLEFGKRMADSV